MQPYFILGDNDSASVVADVEGGNNIEKDVGAVNLTTMML